MPKTKFTFGKISATPTPSSWSQAYNAGALFVVLSLSVKDGESETEPLAGIGKSFLNELEAEFFTLEEKSLTEITKALEKVVANVSDNVTLTSVLAFIKEDTLYLLLVGKGSIIIKRGGNIGTLLSGSDETSRQLHSASGQLKANDCIFLATDAFRTLVSDESITEALSLDDTEAMTEALTPHVHKTEEGSACAIVFRMEGSVESEPEEAAFASPQSSDTEEPQAEGIPKDGGPTSEPDRPTERLPEESMENAGDRPLIEKEPSEKPPLSSKIASMLPLSIFSGLSHRKKVFLSIAGVLIVILIASIIFTFSNQQAQERKALFNEIYPEAQKNYEEAEGIISLNKIQARKELEEAQSLLAKTDGKFPNGTSEYEKTEELRGKIESLLTRLGDSVEVRAEEIAKDENLLMASLIPEGRIAVVEDETSVYFLTEDEIGSIRKASKSEQELVTNDGDWDTPTGLGKFGSNFYVLDKTSGIVKLVPSGSDYSASNYLKEDVEMADAMSLAIDSSIYVLFENGSIKKFTRGAEEEFGIKGLEAPFSTPTQIFTTEDIESLYVLDPKASRIVKLSKSGSFEEEYLSSVLEGAKGFSIASDEKTAYVLSNGKIYSLPL